jgi:hypothetical protein
VHGFESRTRCQTKSAKKNPRDENEVRPPVRQSPDHKKSEAQNAEPAGGWQSRTRCQTKSAKKIPGTRTKFDRPSGKVRTTKRAKLKTRSQPEAGNPVRAARRSLQKKSPGRERSSTARAAWAGPPRTHGLERLNNIVATKETLGVGLPRPLRPAGSHSRAARGRLPRAERSIQCAAPPAAFLGDSPRWLLGALSDFWRWSASDGSLQDCRQVVARHCGT